MPPISPIWIPLGAVVAIGGLLWSFTAEDDARIFAWILVATGVTWVGLAVYALRRGGL